MGLAYSLIFLAFGISYLAWYGNPVLLPLAILFPAVWTFSKSRYIAFYVGLVYQITASFGLAKGTSQYFDSTAFYGIAIWLLAGVVQSIPYILLWHTKKANRTWRIPVLILALAIPPIGIIGWANPLTAAGIIFPGFGWVGFVLTIGLIMMISKWPITSLFPILISTFLFVFPYDYQKVPEGWKGFETRFPYSEKRDYVADFHRQFEVMELVRSNDEGTLVFAESLGGFWTDQTAQLWNRNIDLKDKSVLIGAEVPSIDNTKSENVILALDNEGYAIKYRQRMPVPLSMWRPFSDSGFVPNWFKNPVFMLRESRVAPLVCYEQLLVWPVLHSMVFNPDVIVAVGNGWWADGNRVLDQQRMIVLAWGRLFGVATILAYNK